MEKLKSLNAKKLLGNLILIVFIIIFVAMFGKIFGIENNYLGVGIITAILMGGIMDIDLPLKDSVIAIIASLIIMAISTYLSRLNVFAGIFINFVTVFYAMQVFGRKPETKTFLPFMLCYVFLESSPITKEQLPLRMIATIIGAILFGLSYYLSHKKKEENKKTSLYKQLTTIERGSLQFNFAVRMALGITIANLIGSYFGFEKSMWISITVMSLTQPHLHQTKERVKHRVLGTLLGAVVFVLLFNFLIPKSLSTYALLFLSYVYTFIEEYKFKMIFITINSLGSVMLLYGMNTSVPMRIVFILVGTVIAFIVNKHLYGRFEKSQDSMAIEM